MYFLSTREVSDPLANIPLHIMGLSHFSFIFSTLACKDVVPNFRTSIQWNLRIKDMHGSMEPSSKGACLVTMEPPNKVLYSIYVVFSICAVLIGSSTVVHGFRYLRSFVY